jgi:RNA polymerase sigma factor (sigma-70 family)
MLRVLSLRTARSKVHEQPASRVEDELVHLVTESRRGDAAALRTLLIAVGPPMLQVIRRVLGSRHPDVEDALQEATLALVRALPQFRGECTTKHFGCRVATFTAISMRRRHRRSDEARVDDGDPDDRAAVPGTGGSDAAWGLAAERRVLVRCLLDELPEPQAEGLVLHSIMGLTVEEVAAATGVPIETARSRLRLARAALRLRIVGDPIASELLGDLS